MTSDLISKRKQLLEKRLQQLKNGGTAGDANWNSGGKRSVKLHLKVKKRTTPYKSVMCLFWLEGRCRKTECWYAHGESELRPAPGASISPETNAFPAMNASGLPPQFGGSSIFAVPPLGAPGVDVNTFAALQMQQQAMLGPGADGGLSALTAALSGAGLAPSTLNALAGNGPEAGAQIAAAAKAAQQYQSLLLMNSMSGGPAGAGAPEPSAPLDLSTSSTRKNFKMQMCKFFQDGKCVKGTMCPYAHGQDEMTAAAVRAARVEATLVAAMKEGSRNDVCYDFRDRGKCRFGVTCKFSHNLEIPDPAVRVGGMNLSGSTGIGR